MLTPVQCGLGMLLIRGCGHYVKEHAIHGYSPFFFRSGDRNKSEGTAEGGVNSYFY